MFGKAIAALIVATLLAVPAQAQDAKAVIASASKAMGVDTLKTVQYSATGLDFALGQAPNPGARGRSSSTRATPARSTSRAPASRVERVRVQGENPPRGGGQQPIVGEQPQNQTIIVDAEHAVGAAARDLDDAARLPARGGRAETPRSKPQTVGGKKLHTW